MQRLLSILLLFGILGQATVRTAWTLHYQWNRATYIAKCENKDKPKLHCEGKCAFMKQLAAREKNNSREPQLPESFTQIRDIQLFFEPFSDLQIVGTETMAKTRYPLYLRRMPIPPVEDVFHPPA